MTVHTHTSQRSTPANTQYYSWNLGPAAAGVWSSASCNGVSANACVTGAGTGFQVPYQAGMGGFKNMLHVGFKTYGNADGPPSSEPLLLKELSILAGNAQFHVSCTAVKFQSFCSVLGVTLRFVSVYIFL